MPWRQSNYKTIVPRRRFPVLIIWLRQTVKTKEWRSRLDESCRNTMSQLQDLFLKVQGKITLLLMSFMSISSCYADIFCFCVTVNGAELSFGEEQCFEAVRKYNDLDIVYDMCLLTYLHYVHYFILVYGFSKKQVSQCSWYRFRRLLQKFFKKIRNWVWNPYLEKQMQPFSLYSSSKIFWYLLLLGPLVVDIFWLHDSSGLR